MDDRIPQEYYDLLEISPGASAEEIERAYQRAIKGYAGDSPALYALFTPEEKQRMLLKIEEAYRALKDGRGNAAPPDHGTVFAEIDPSMFMPGPAGREFFRAKSAARLNPSPDALDPAALEQYSILFARLENMSAQGAKRAFAITSSVKGEGKSVTALNLSYIMAAKFKKKTVLVECDLRKPSTLAPKIEQYDRPGLVNVLKGECDLSDAMTRIDGTSLFVIPAGPFEKNSAELLSTPRLGKVIGELKGSFDYVIIDSPPLLPLVDMNIISRMVDGVIAVVRAGKTPKDIVQKALDSLPGAEFVGIVLNGADTKLGKYYY